MIYTFLQADGGMTSTFILMGALFVVMFFFMIRPQMQRQKKEKRFQQELKVGDRVVTLGGIHGKIVEIQPDTVTIETQAGKLRFERSAISNDISMQRYGKDEKAKAT